MNGNNQNYQNYQNNYQQPNSPMGPPQRSVSEVIQPLYNVKGWIRFLGIFQIIIGAMYCLTIVGAIFGWFPLLIGIKLNNVAGALERAISGDDFSAIESTENLGFIFKLMGIMIIVSLLFSILMGVLYVFIIAGAIAAASSSGQF